MATGVESLSELMDRVRRFTDQTSVDLYDLLPIEDREAIEWVREHGGIEAVKKRLMPEGMEWPRTESGEPVKLGDKLIDDDELEEWREVDTIIFQRTEDGHRIEIENDRGVTQFYHPGERVKRPEPNVLAADGGEIRVGDTVYRVGKSTFDPEYDALTVTDIRTKPGLTPIEVKNSHDGYSYGHPEDFTHRAPVLAADGKPLREGETVWSVDSGARYTVEKITDELIPIKCCSEMSSTVSLHPSQLTHERPDTRAQVIDGMDKETVEKIDKLVRDGRWLDD